MLVKLLFVPRMYALGAFSICVRAEQSGFKIMEYTCVTIMATQNEF